MNDTEIVMPGDVSDEPRGHVSYAELQRHTTQSSLWVLIGGTVYDVTSLLSSHPGGTGPLFKYAGKDATREFMQIHPPDALNTLPHSVCIGPIDPTTVPRTVREPTAEENRIAKAREALPHPRSALNLVEIEELAKRVLSARAWSYYRSGGDDEITFTENRKSFSRFWFRPLVLNKISQASTASTILGMPSSLPIFIAPAALARLGHPDGEMNLVRAAGRTGILQGISNNASCSVAEIMSVKRPKQHLFFQLYMNKDRVVTEKVVRGLQSNGFSAIMLTVDAAMPGKRELDQRTIGDWDGPAANGKAGSENKGIAHSIGGYQDPDVCWNDIPWIRSLTKLPLVIKGIQCLEDAERALEVYKVDGIVLSNHGGRQLDYSPAPMAVLYEMRQVRPDLLDRYQVFIDGGVTRGTDVLKALCLGARAVGLGRAFLYANSVWGEEGCMRVIEILREEIMLGMQLLGVSRLEQLTAERVRNGDGMRRALRSRL
ncbi:FMN-dependent dehydrogenase-domain-containing protein [Russula vinacea]|nr:FMN-dependent dehydrogenase-domain-containing protein [Russula vinacea]